MVTGGGDRGCCGLGGGSSDSSFLCDTLKRVVITLGVLKKKGLPVRFCDSSEI